jgi:hypothetical protein
VKRFRTERRLWLVVSLAAYIGLGFVDFEDDDRTVEHTLWGAVRMLVTQKVDPEYVLPAIFGYGTMFLVPAVILGWLIQALTVMLRSTPTTRNG